ncbi:putative A/G-specific adenine glycosylase YfhQ [Phycisphaerae bacterium RAS1]|nr:putative A/G-specific adenine glycosylase YfhQ [Phycisphaerae bacterium RAS1]
MHIRALAVNRNRDYRGKYVSKAQLSALRRRLLAWYRRSARDLPWRRTGDAYRIWVSEVMLQQTQAATVVPYFERFISAFPTVEELARAPQQRVLKLWEGLGYYSRARNLHTAAALVVRQRCGRLPTSAADWQTLPGVGRYTAAAIASIAYGEPVAVLDGNVARVLARLLALGNPIDAPATRAALWEEAQRLLAPQAPGDFNQAMMELGARVCTPRNPSCGACPLRRHCLAAARGIADELPVKRARPAVPHVRAAAAAIECDGRYLLVRRPQRGLLAGLWQLPTVEVNQRAAARELREHVRSRLAYQIRVGPLVATIRHQFTHRLLDVSVYRCVCAHATHHSVDTRWLTPARFGSLPMSVLDRKLAACLV